MILVRSPLRVSFCGGGSDIPSFYHNNYGCVINTTIDKYVYLTLNRISDKNKIILKYPLGTETVYNVDNIQHSRFKQCFKDNDINGGIEINVMSDVDAGTGLGSSSAFTVGLLKTLYEYKNKLNYKSVLAERACDVEIDELGYYGGKQDQYASAFGGLNFIEFDPKHDKPIVHPINISDTDLININDNLLMFNIGGCHDSSSIHKHIEYNLDRVQILKSMVSITIELLKRLENGDIDYLGKALNDSWILKRSLSTQISNPKIDMVYNLGISAGATGGKLLGAGSAGYVLFYADKSKHNKIRKALKDFNEMKFNFEYDGAKTLYCKD